MKEFMKCWNVVYYDQGDPVGLQFKVAIKEDHRPVIYGIILLK
jgi:hypothetical protein